MINTLAAEKTVWSACGQRDFFIVLDYEISLQNKAKVESDLVAVNQSEFQVQWRYCQ